MNETGGKWRGLEKKKINNYKGTGKFKNQLCIVTLTKTKRTDLEVDRGWVELL